MLTLKESQTGFQKSRLHMLLMLHSSQCRGSKVKDLWFHRGQFLQLKFQWLRQFRKILSQHTSQYLDSRQCKTKLNFLAQKSSLSQNAWIFLF